MAKLAYDKYYTESDLAKYCVEKTFETIGSDWERVIEPSVGVGAFLPFLPENTIYYDLVPDENCPGTIEMDWREVKLPYIKQSLVIGNPPYVGEKGNKDICVKMPVAVEKHLYWIIHTTLAKRV